MAPPAVLVIDDDPDDAELARLALEEALPALGVRVVTRREQLAPALAAATPRLVLCDLNFPGWPCREIRAELLRAAPDARFVLLTGALPPDGDLPAVDAVLLKDRLHELPALLRRLLPGTR